jgi:hypothetical protein
LPSIGLRLKSGLDFLVDAASAKGRRQMKKGRRIDIDNVKILKDIDDYFDEIMDGARPSTEKYSSVYKKVGRWYSHNRNNEFELKWSSPEDRVRYIAKAINHKGRQLERKQDSRTRRKADNHQQESCGLGGWRENNSYTQSGIEFVLDEDSGEVDKMMKREKGWGE